MCGIAGVVRADSDAPVEHDLLLRMAAALRHRGPDGFGVAAGAGVGLVSTRLAIVDLDDGWQPMQARPGGSVLVYNGEVYNHPELRELLGRRGVRCRTRTDTEVVLRLLEREGLSALARFNGQFALAWWQPERRRLTLVRDRFGVRPLSYALSPRGDLVFGSEASALFATGEVDAAPDLHGLDDVFTSWGARAPRSVFRDVRRLGPGGVLVWEDGRVVLEGTWWEPEVSPSPDAVEPDELGDLLRDSVRLRLRADVKVGCYLSGGLDSSLVSALACQEATEQVSTFSVAFDDPRYDESAHQLEVADALGTDHHVLRIGPSDLVDGFQEAVRHAESPFVRTGPVPMALLAGAARAHGVTVIATGEGADELFWGYDLFKEVRLRRAIADGRLGDEALDGLYPHLADRARGPAWRRSFLLAGQEEDPLFSHQTRIAAGSATRALYRSEVDAVVGTDGSARRLRAGLPAGFAGWDDLSRATWLELTTLLEPYLLSAQGDRMSMAHGVEGRYPFLDHRVFEHAVRLPPTSRLDGARDKVALRRLAEQLLPAGIAARPKQPYRAPEVEPFFGAGTRDWVQELLSPAALSRVGIFDAPRTAGLLRRCRQGRVHGQRESMALVGVLSTQVWFEQFCGAMRWVAEQEQSRPRVFLDLDRYEQGECAS
jgi:asparagine synthase (glutamine-hydrolysing)